MQQNSLHPLQNKLFRIVSSFKILLFRLLLSFVIFTACVNETSNVVDTNNITENIFIKFNSFNHDLQNASVSIEYTFINQSKKTVLLGGSSTLLGFIVAEKIETKINNRWVMINNFSFQSVYPVIHNKSKTDLFSCFYPGEVRIKVPIIFNGNEKDTVTSSVITVQNSFQEQLDCNLTYINSDSSLSIKIKNLTQDTLKFYFHPHSSCYFTYLSYYIIENDSLKKLYLHEEEKIKKWKPELYTNYDYCSENPPNEYLFPGSTFEEKRLVLFPKGKIIARLWFATDVINNTVKTIYKEFVVQ